MGFSTCPATTVAAPVERVWSRLNDPTNYDEWWDAQAESITPPGLATPGQRVVATTREMGRRWTVRFLVEAVNESAHQVVLHTDFPFAMTMRTVITAAPRDEQSSWLQFG